MRVVCILFFCRTAASFNKAIKSDAIRLSRFLLKTKSQQKQRQSMRRLLRRYKLINRTQLITSKNHIINRRLNLYVPANCFN
jgi:hypothetical protein